MFRRRERPLYFRWPAWAVRAEVARQENRAMLTAMYRRQEVMMQNVETLKVSLANLDQKVSDAIAKYEAGQNGDNDAEKVELNAAVDEATVKVDKAAADLEATFGFKPSEVQ